MLSKSHEKSTEKYNFRKIKFDLWEEIFIQDGNLVYFTKICFSNNFEKDKVRGIVFEAKKKSLSIVILKIPDPGKTIYLALFSFYSLRKKIFSVEKMVNLPFIPPETSPGISSWQLNLNHDSEQRCVFLEALS